MSIDIDFRSPDTTVKRLSNLDYSPFCFLGKECASIEGVLQSLKFSNPTDQARIIQLYGFQAKFAGKGVPWEKLHFFDLTMDRASNIYQLFLQELYFCMFEQNPDKLQLLLDTGNQDLTHSIGHNNTPVTVLTKDEFINNLLHIRTHFQNKQGSIYVY